VEREREGTILPITLAWLAAFAASLVVVLAASDRLVKAVEAAGDRYHWPTGLVGLLAAAGADGPEVSSALIALRAGAHDVSLGVIVGSNLFNLAALLGLPILLVGHVAVQRHGLLVSGGAMLLTTALSILLLLGDTPLPFVEALVVATLLGYALLLVHSRDAAPMAVPTVVQISPREEGDVELEERAREREVDRAEGFPSGLRLLIQGLLATAVVIGGCDVLVNAALFLAARMGVPQTLTGTFGLAALTSLPNVWVALSLARRHRGAVMVSAVCNSNTINAVFGICLLAPFRALRPASIVRHLDLPALLALTLLALVLVWQGRGLGRYGALALVLAYGGFVAARLALSS
jgi:cation:H+ antiporter